MTLHKLGVKKRSKGEELLLYMENRIDGLKDAAFGFLMTH